MLRVATRGSLESRETGGELKSKIKRFLLGTSPVMLLSVSLLQCHRSTPAVSMASTPSVKVEKVQPVSIVKREAKSMAPSSAELSLSKGAAMTLEEKIEADPLAFLHEIRDRYDKMIEDYSCVFTRQEYVNGAHAEEEQMAVEFRQEPFSVHMEWLSDAGEATEALYVAGAWPDKEGNDQFWAKPSGSFVKLIAPSVQQPIHGYFATRNARRTIDQFGFRRNLDLIIKYSEEAKERGELIDLSYVGQSALDGRPTYVIERRLPHEKGTEEPYPDRLLVVHVDKEWLVPTGCFSYQDDDGKELLGKYMFTDVKFNQGFGEKDFDPEALGF